MAGTVFAVTSGKGGVGKTTTATNLAVALEADETSAVVLDADLGMPDVGAFLGIDPEVTLHDVLAGRSEIDAAIAKSDVGIDVVPGAPELEEFADADPDALGSVLESLRERYRHVVVDTGGGLSYETVSPIELADSIVLVTTPLPAAIADARKTKTVTDRLGVPVAGVVVTRVTEDTNLESIAAELGVKLLGRVAFDPRVHQGAVDGTPIVTAAPDSQPATAYRHIASVLTGEPQAGSETESESSNGENSGNGSELESGTETEDASASAEMNATEIGEQSGPTSEPDSGAAAGSNAKPEPESDADDEDADDDVAEETGDEPEIEDDAGSDAVTEESNDDSSQETTGATPPESGAESAADEPTDTPDSGSKGGLFGRLFGWLR